jgi:nucleoside-diphosphate-sugar epimerase
MKHVLITGGCGFVLSNLARHLLDHDPGTWITILDRSGPDQAIERFFASNRNRLEIITGDIGDKNHLDSIAFRAPISHIVHGAAITHDAEREKRDPMAYVDTNLTGTIKLLNFASSLPALRCFLHVSTGGVYGRPGPQSPEGPQPETGPFDPPEFYAITKYAAELAARRMGELFNIAVVIVRLSDVFGPMERPTSYRRQMSLPWHMIQSLLVGRPLQISGESLEAGGDYLSAEDVSAALALLLLTSHLPHQVFNIAAGVRRDVPELLSTFARVAPGFRFEVTKPESAEIRLDPTNRLARYNAYDISRISVLGWRQRPLAEQFATYVAWARAESETS